MSRYLGAAYHTQDGSCIGYFQYEHATEGKSFILYPDLLSVPSYGSPTPRWRRQRADGGHLCSADSSIPFVSTPCWLFTEYGGGYHWRSTYCPICLSIDGVVFTPEQFLVPIPFSRGYPEVFMEDINRRIRAEWEGP